MFGNYAGFIIPSYLVTALIFAILVAASMWNHRSCRRELATLEERGVRRRSQAAGDIRE